MTDEPEQDESRPDRPKRLLLMRHAKSDWGDAGLTDHQRPLNKRGRRDAPAMGQWLVENDCCPTRILCSSAVRTRETFDRLQPQLEAKPDVFYSDLLYGATAETLARVVRREGDNATSLMVIAHNPGISELVSCLAGEYIGMSTAAIAVFESPVDSWDDFKFDKHCVPMKMIQFMRPKELSV
ncbi:phosphohistidine phosphatase [Novipirellula aureliae]|uniref:Phosphohistidine phosphatase n=1 Tax=Novipirellula aureliae TaxID=2527966 RepID=A0A5C6DJ39_9BACT|nr:histidine phosphatase family protein [Novipirellula aureliae]TWU36602.1 phosphohistidine phosphatase [Novipirellula aureliae]